MSSTSYDALYLVETTERIFIQPTTPRAGDRFIIINRINDDISISTDHSLIPERDRLKTITIAGVLGVIRLIAGPYLVYIKEREQVGRIGGTHVVCKLKQFDVIPFKRTLLHVTAKQKSLNNTYLDMLRTCVDTPSFYYSNSYDLSHNMQSLDTNSPDFLKHTLVERADERFVWNKVMLNNFHHGRTELHRFCVPVIHGFVSISQTTVNSKTFKFILISRRSAKRPGTRLFSRGVDEEGNVSNFVETEQIIEYGNDIASFVQIRGSIPLFWSQKPNLKYKPKPLITPLNHAEAYTRHFQELNLRYGKITSVNLVNQTGSEGELELKFRSQSQALQLHNTTYEAFDFHHECRKMNWERLEVLINRLTNDLQEFEYFMRGRVRKQQEGVFRTNCIDCLDRTNVVQGMLAKVNVEQVFKRMGIFGDADKVKNHPDFEHLFKNVWADNGDIVSIEYSGTGALKADFTRTGKRTFKGVMRDGLNASVRYFKNNFADGFRQDAMDLFVGNYTVNIQEGAELRCPLEKNRDWKYLTLPTLLVISVVMFFSVFMFPQENVTESRAYMLFWAMMSVTCSGVILHYGKEFVDNPVLTEAPGLAM